MKCAIVATAAQSWVEPEADSSTFLQGLILHLLQDWGVPPMIAALTLTPVVFDYSVIDADLASNLRRQAKRIRTRIGKATQDLIDIRSACRQEAPH